MNRDSITVATAANNAYAPHVAAMLHSLFSANPCRIFEIYFLHGVNFSDLLLSRLRDLCEQFQAQFHSVSIDSELFEDVPKSERYVEEAWYRIRLPSILCDLDRLLWLDADTVVVGDISDLWEKDLGPFHLAATKNAIYPEDKSTLQSLGLNSPKNYFNSGVMLLNLAAMRSSGAESAMVSTTAKLSEQIKYADQDVLNVVYEAEYLPLELHWNLIAGAYFNVAESVNVHGYEAYRSALASPRIVHFTGLKPWLSSSYHPYRAVYLYHRKMAGWGLPERQFDFLTFLQRSLPIKVRIAAMKLLRLRFREFFLTLRLKYTSV